MDTGVTCSRRLWERTWQKMEQASQLGPLGSLWVIVWICYFTLPLLCSSATPWTVRQFFHKKRDRKKKTAHLADSSFLRLWPRLGRSSVSAPPQRETNCYMPLNIPFRVSFRLTPWLREYHNNTTDSKAHLLSPNRKANRKQEKPSVLLFPSHNALIHRPPMVSNTCSYLIFTNQITVLASRANWLT